MSGDPIPQKSEQLFVPQIDVWGPSTRPKDATGDAQLPTQLTYRDAVAFMQARAAKRQAAMYAMQLDVTPQSGTSFSEQGRATYGDFFEMFPGTFRGRSWMDQTGGHRSCRRGGAGRGPRGTLVSTSVPGRTDGQSRGPTVSRDRRAGSVESVAAVLRCRRQRLFGGRAIFHSVHYGRQPPDWGVTAAAVCRCLSRVGPGIWLVSAFGFSFGPNYRMPRQRANTCNS